MSNTMKKVIAEIRVMFPYEKPEGFDYSQAREKVLFLATKHEELIKDAKIKDTRYPRQIYSAGRKEIILSIENFLDPPSEKDTVPPLEMHSPFSRYVITIIDKSGAKIVTPKANIPAGDVAGIVAIARAAMMERVRYSESGNESEAQSTVSSAYTQMIPFGRFKNKTPAMVLLDNPDEKAELLKTRGFFQENVAKYPQNQKQIDAIDDAVSLLDAGTLKQEDASQVKSGMKTIYAVSHKYMADTNAQGHRLFYGMTIECYYGKEYPWVVTIENFFAPGQQTAKGGLTPRMEEKSAHARSIINLSDTEWSQMVSRMESNLQNFETLWYGKLYRESLDIDKANREARKAAQPASQAAAA